MDAKDTPAHTFLLTENGFCHQPVNVRTQSPLPYPAFPAGLLRAGSPLASLAEHATIAPL
ncbi:MAG: hypothetical protein ABF752_02920 [Acetobacter fabarum]|uniref:hypothetical protein n=1 Tax=Acetobacter fabarum TaxID=483199 RepID=UPI0039EB07BB